MSNTDGINFPYCVIREVNTTNVAFSCGHITTCDKCAYCISFCAECSTIAGERLRVTYNGQLRALVIEKLEQPQTRQ